MNENNSSSISTSYKIAKRYTELKVNQTSQVTIRSKVSTALGGQTRKGISSEPKHSKYPLINALTLSEWAETYRNEIKS